MDYSPITHTHLFSQAGYLRGSAFRHREPGLQALCSLLQLLGLGRRCVPRPCALLQAGSQRFRGSLRGVELLSKCFVCSDALRMVSTQSLSMRVLQRQMGWCTASLAAMIPPPASPVASALRVHLPRRFPSFPMPPSVHAIPSQERCKHRQFAASPCVRSGTWGHSTCY